MRESTFCCVHNGIISEDELDNYKKTDLKDLLKKLEEYKNNSDSTDENITDKDLTFSEEEVSEE